MNRPEATLAELRLLGLVRAAELARSTETGRLVRLQAEYDWAARAEKTTANLKAVRKPVDGS